MAKTKCISCRGRGKVPIDFDGPVSHHVAWTKLRVPYKICPTCNGTGMQEKIKKGDVVRHKETGKLYRVGSIVDLHSITLGFSQEPVPIKFYEKKEVE